MLLTDFAAFRTPTRATTVPRAGARRGNRSVRLVLVGLAGLFIVFGPAVGQVFGRHSRFLREWVMFSAGGVGVLKGAFTVHVAGLEPLRLTPLEVLGLDRYPGARSYEFDRLVLEDADLRLFASDRCDRLAGASRLSFQGFVGTRQGWRPLDIGDVCAAHPAAAGEGSRR